MSDTYGRETMGYFSLVEDDVFDLLVEEGIDPDVAERLCERIGRIARDHTAGVCL